MDLSRKIIDAIGNEFCGEENTADILTEIVGRKAHCYDNYIDDGCDNKDCEDRYVMCAAFNFEDSPLVVRVYYGDITETIGYVSVNGVKEHANKLRAEFDRPFNITSICRSDLEGMGFDTTDITDAQMEELARRMCNDYLEQMFWLSMEIIAEDIMKFPKK